MKKDDLQRAGIKNATKVVILAPCLADIYFPHGNFSRHKEENEEEAK